MAKVVSCLKHAWANRAGIKRYFVKIEIWSDIMCPFCYLGKGRLEQALAAFPGKAEVEITWKSFQLNPDMPNEPGITLEQYLVDRKGWSPDRIRAGHERIARAGAELGLHYDFDRAVVANSLDAHRLIQAAKAEGKGDVMEDRLFRAYFGEGKSIADHGVLAALAVDAGLDAEKARAVLADPQAYAAEVQADLREAAQLGVTGVPFFVFNRKFAVSGAQDSEVFAQALAQAASG